MIQKRFVSLLLCAALALCLLAGCDTAASTDFREQPETPGPQPRQGSKASDVPVMLNSEFSSKFGRRPEVLASLVVLGMFSLDALAELLAGAGDRTQLDGENHRNGFPLGRGA